MDSTGPVEPAEVRPAATVVVARPGRDGPQVEVLVARRAATSRFAPGFVVFPGGVVEEGDGALAGRWFGSGSESARACAARELAEEAGIALTASGPVSAPPGPQSLERVEASPPRARDLPQIARWLAPEFLAVRFDARFFAVACPRGVEPEPDGVEVDRAWWARPSAVLQEFELWRSLMWPTYSMLRALVGCPTVGAVLELRVPQQPPPPGGRSAGSPEWSARGGGS
jgi:8-oxo-dGTP pyrophosphatase MutT (NUDIX family)